jgi:hypothetical protein
MSDSWKNRAHALLQAAKDVAPDYALRWYQSLIDVEEERVDDHKLAAQAVKERWPVGAVAQGRVIAVIRKYWLECAALNLQLKDSEKLAPEDFVLERLMVKGPEKLARFLSPLPYWPIGLDREGNWV